MSDVNGHVQMDWIEILLKLEANYTNLIGVIGGWKSLSANNLSRWSLGEDIFDRRDGCCVVMVQNKASLVDFQDSCCYDYPTLS